MSTLLRFPIRRQGFQVGAERFAVARTPFRAAVMGLALAACATTPTLVGRPRPAIAPDGVRLFLEPPAGPYEPIALLDASSAHAFAFTAEGKAQVVIRRLKAQAAALGANGVLLEQITDDPDETAVTGGVGTRYWGARGDVDLGVSAALTANQYGRGTAIYLAPSGTPVP